MTVQWSSSITALLRLLSEKDDISFLMSPSWDVLPRSCYLVFNFIRPKALVDGVQYSVTLITTSSSIKAGVYDPVWAGEVSPPAQLEAIVHRLTTWAGIPVTTIQLKSVLNVNMSLLVLQSA